MTFEEKLYRIMLPVWNPLKDAIRPFVNAFIRTSRGVWEIFQPEPDDWAVVVKMPNRSLEIVGVYGSFNLASIIYAGLLDAGAEVSMMRLKDAENWNLNLEHYKQWEGENGIS